MAHRFVDGVFIPLTVVWEGSSQVIWTCHRKQLEADGAALLVVVEKSGAILEVFVRKPQFCLREVRWRKYEQLIADAVEQAEKSVKFMPDFDVEVGEVEVGGGCGAAWWKRRSPTRRLTVRGSWCMKFELTDSQRHLVTRCDIPLF